MAVVGRVNHVRFSLTKIGGDVISKHASTAGADPESRPVRFIDVLRVPTFAALYAAETQSVLGDQLARVALSVLVFERTNSAADTALTYALTFLPTILGGAFLSGLADRFSRRGVMVIADLLRAALFAMMAIHSLPTPALFVLLFVAVLVGPAFQSAEVSTIADVLNHPQYRVATALRLMSNQMAQVAGFAIGGVIIGTLSPRWGLAIDALSFGLSALLIAVAPLRAPGGVIGRHRDEVEPGKSLVDCVRALLADPLGRKLIGLSLLAAFFVVPEGLAAPYIAEIGGGAGSVRNLARGHSPGCSDRGLRGCARAAGPGSVALRRPDGSPRGPSAHRVHGPAERAGVLPALGGVRRVHCVPGRGHDHLGPPDPHFVAGSWRGHPWRRAHGLARHRDRSVRLDSYIDEHR